MTEHSTIIKVNLSFYITLETESHPEDIDDKTMKNLVTEYADDYLRTAIEHGTPTVESLIDTYDFEEVTQIENGERTKI